MTRKNLTLILMVVSTIYWGIWLGGYLFNALMVVPTWSHDPPDSLIEFDRQMRVLVYFFTAVNPWIFFVSLAAWLFSRKVETAARPWLGRATLVAWIMLPLKVWMVILISGVFNKAIYGGFDANAETMMNMWKGLNWVTTFVGFAIFLMHVIAVLNFREPLRLTSAKND